MVNFNANISGAMNSINGTFGPNGVQQETSAGTQKIGGADGNKTEFANTVKGIENYISKVDELQQSSDMSIKDLLSGKNEEEPPGDMYPPGIRAFGMTDMQADGVEHPPPKGMIFGGVLWFRELYLRSFREKCIIELLYLSNQENNLVYYPPV